MEMMCYMCNGSGWSATYPFGLTTPKPIFIYIPCKECKGNGFIQLPDKPKEEEKKDGAN
jgi:hypothetical protein